MTIYEELYYGLADFPKFYRYEGIKTFKNYDFDNSEFILTNFENYIYFSASQKHHFYYVEKRIRQLIERDILYQTKYNLQRKKIINSENFRDIITRIENYPLDAKQTSIEFTTSPLIKKLFAKNFILNSRKKENVPYIERVDISKPGGGMDLAKIG